MSERRLGTGFHFSKVMAWAPVLILILGLVFVIRGDLTVGLLFGAAALIFWFIVRRRKTQATK